MADGAASVAALRIARAVAGTLGAELEALTGWGSGGTSPRVRDEFRRAAQIAQSRSIADALGPDALAPRTRVERGSAAALLSAAGRGAAMVVVGRGRFEALRGVLLGAVAMATAAQAPCPVVVVPAELAGPHPADRILLDSTVGA